MAKLTRPGSGCTLLRGDGDLSDCDSSESSDAVVGSVLAVVKDSNASKDEFGVDVGDSFKLGSDNV